MYHRAVFNNDPQKTKLAQLLANCPPNDVLLHHEGGVLAGHVLLDALEESGYPVDDVDAVASSHADLALALSVMYAAASRGLELDVVPLERRGDCLVDSRIVVVGIHSAKSEVTNAQVVARAVLIGQAVNDDELAVYSPADIDAKASDEK